MSIQRLLHFTLNCISVPIWLIFALSLYVLVHIAKLGEILYPDSRYGNCWTYALPKWKFSRGYPKLVVSTRRVGFLKIPHASLLHADGKIEETEPVLRFTSTLDSWFGLKTLYFKFYVKK